MDYAKAQQVSKACWPAGAGIGTNSRVGLVSDRRDSCPLSAVSLIRMLGSYDGT